MLFTHLKLPDQLPKCPVLLARLLQQFQSLVKVADVLCVQL